MKKKELKNKKFRILRGDKVKVIAGANRGTVAQVVSVIPEKDSVFLDLIKRKKHKKAGANQEKGAIIEIYTPIHISNVALFEDKSKTKTTRIGYKIEKDRKFRFAKKTGKEIK